MKRNPAYIGLGSNLGNREQNLAKARSLLETRIVRVSSLYETEPVGFVDQPWFLNAVIEIEAEWSPQDLLKQCQRVEEALYRERIIAKGPRTLDLDILFYDELIVDEPDLVIPHPAVPDRRFVLEPLCEIAPDLMHPILRKTISELLQLCPDRSVVRKLQAS